MEKNIIIELKDVKFTNVDYVVLENINTAIEKYGISVIIGKSGSGKSTLLKLMSGILTPDNGTIKIDNIDFSLIDERKKIELKKEIGFVFQDAALLSNLTIKENLELPLKFHQKNLPDKEIDSIIRTHLEKVDMLESLNERPAQLSMGEKKLVSFARAIICKPKILFLDEPLSSLDPTISKKIIGLIKEYFKTENSTIIIVTNHHKIISELTNRIILIENKTITLDDKMENILKQDKEKIPQIISDFLVM